MRTGKDLKFRDQGGIKVIPKVLHMGSLGRLKTKRILSCQIAVGGSGERCGWRVKNGNQARDPFSEPGSNIYSELISIH